MASFTNELDTALGRIRLEIGDGTFEQGVKPDGKNFTDAELQHFLDTEDDDEGRAAARALEIAALMWARVPDEHRLGPETVVQKTADRLKAAAAALRLRYGLTVVATTTLRPYASGAVPVVVNANGATEVYRP
jgi:hypothetical protein